MTTLKRNWMHQSLLGCILEDFYFINVVTYLSFNLKFIGWSRGYSHVICYCRHFRFLSLLFMEQSGQWFQNHGILYLR